MASTVQCPTCRAPVPWEGNLYRPFCSERCQLIDLGAWVEGKYRIQGESLDKDSEKEDEDNEEKPD
jgi:endogenous inhibitor of DNA gyrase (YacG/DUF329 family)